ncbi:hypothetical protein ACGLWX_01400 [Halomonas sp. HMF6819]|uniref:hypothetical protein n=1 Tax=Halomonas sp. HMF6819 TaxID=3373085 RepID=UPI0037A9B17F
MMKPVGMLAALLLMSAAHAQENRYTFDDMEQTVNEAFSRGVECQASTDEVMTPECEAFMEFHIERYSTGLLKFGQEMNTADYNVYGGIKESRIDEMFRKIDEIGKMETFIDSLSPRSRI